MHAEVSSSPPDPVEATTPTGSLLPQVDPWGLIVVGAQRGVAPLCSEAARLGFEVFRARRLGSGDVDRLQSADWAAAVVVDDGSDMSTTRSLLETHLLTAVPVIWVGDTPGVPEGRPFVRLPAGCDPGRLAATVFDRARRYLYPPRLVGELRRTTAQVLGTWGEQELRWGPIWVKNHLSPAFSMTASLDLFGDVSGELCVGADREWFGRKGRDAGPDPLAPSRSASTVAAAIGEALLKALAGSFERAGADLSVGVPRVHEGGDPVDRQVSHRPALCMELATADGQLMVIEFSGTGLDVLDGPRPTTSDFNPPISL